MTAAHSIRAEFRSVLGNFTLDAAFEAPAAGVTAVFGPSGCGKTTILRCIAGLIRIKDGFCDIDGDIWQDRDRAFLPTHRRPLGYVFQEASLFPHLSVRRNLLFGAPREKLVDRPEIDFNEVIDLLGIRALLDRSPRNLSGGERQRVGIGRALLTQPKLLLMDEPLSALDRKTKSEILPFIEKLRDHFSLPIFYITHDMTEVERLADQVVLIDKGHVVASGPLAELQSDPSLPLAMSREAAVTLDGTVETYDSEYGLVAVGVSGGRFLVPAPPAEIGERCRVRILAGDVSLAHEPLGLSSILNTEPSRIVSAKALETNEILAVLALGADGAGGRLLARVTRKSWDMLGLCEGAIIHARVKAVSLRPGRGEFAGSGPSTPLSR
jgi:molybdate transport system ATP-binding protein